MAKSLWGGESVEMVQSAVLQTKRRSIYAGVKCVLERQKSHARFGVRLRLINELIL